MNFLVERMENPGRRNRNILKLNDLSQNDTGSTAVDSGSTLCDVTPLDPPVRISSSTALNNSDDVIKPVIELNGKLVDEGKSQRLNPIRSSSQRNLTSVFRNDLFHSNSNNHSTYGIQEESSGSSSSSSDEEDEGIIEFPTRKISRRRRESMNKEVQQYSSAFGGKFSDLEFNITTPPQCTAMNIPVSSSPSSLSHLATEIETNKLDTTPMTMRKSSRRFSVNTLSNSPFKMSQSNTNSTISTIHQRRNRSMSNTGFINDSNKAQTRRLVNQFLHSNQTPNHSNPSMTNANSSTSFAYSSQSAVSVDPHSNIELSVLTNHRLKDLSTTSQISDYSNLTFQNLLYQDLDQSHVNSSLFLSNDESPSSSASSFIHNLADDRILDPIPSHIQFNNNVDTRRTTPRSSLSPLELKVQMDGCNAHKKKSKERIRDLLLNERSDPSTMKSYKKHISSVLQDFEEAMKTNLQQIIYVDETNLIKTVGQFDKLAMDLNQSKQQLVDLRNMISCEYLNSLQTEFDDTEKSAFIHRLKESVGGSVSELKRLESKMDQYRNKLAQQRETIKRLENLAKIDNSLVQAKKNTKSVYKYRFIVIDLLIVSVFLYFVTLLKSIFI